MEPSETSSVAGRGVIPDQVRVLAERLSAVHGTVVVTKERSGYHLNMASPVALENDGSIELLKRHLAVNASRYLGLDKFASRQGTEENDRSAMCMKYRRPYRVYDLLYSIPTLADRGIQEPKHKVICHARERKLVSDGRGNMIPPPPGRCVGLSSLPDNHPAVWYLKTYRGYDIDRLEKQFGAAWCVEELSQQQRDSLDIYYSPLPGGFANTPQGRIIFFADIYGVRQGWQGRIPEYQDGNKKFFWHPYRNLWVHCENWDAEISKWVPVAELAKGPLQWKKLQKYKTADYMSRAEVLFGFDAAVEWNVDKVVESCALAEGPLDAGRVGPPGVCMVGGFLSEAQAALLNARFRAVWYVADLDAAGQEAAASVRRHLSGRGLREMTLPEGVKKDLGDLSDTSARVFMAPMVLGAMGYDIKL